MNALPELTAEGQQLNLKFNNQWIANHPLTEADLSQERNRLKLIGIKLSFF